MDFVLVVGKIGSNGPVPCKGCTLSKSLQESAALTWVYAVTIFFKFLTKILYFGLRLQYFLNI